MMYVQSESGPVAILREIKMLPLLRELEQMAEFYAYGAINAIEFRNRVVARCMQDDKEVMVVAGILCDAIKHWAMVN